MDSGCSFIISFCREAFIPFKVNEEQVEGLGIHKITDKVTVKNTIIDNNGGNINILIKNILYVPTLHTRLLSLQQLAQQSEDRLNGAHILGDALNLRWACHKKIVPYHSASNLPILFTVPGGKGTSAYIENGMQHWHGTYLSKDENNTACTNHKIIHEIKGYNENIENTIDPALMTIDEIEETMDKNQLSDKVKDFVTTRKQKIL